MREQLGKVARKLKIVGETRCVSKIDMFLRKSHVSM